MSRVNWGERLSRFAAEWQRTGISPKEWCEREGYSWGTAKAYISIKAAKALLLGGSEKIANSEKKSRNKTPKKSPNSELGKSHKSVSDKACDKNHENGRTPNLPETKPEQSKRKVVTNYPPFQKGNQHALKHGGYARRMLFSDSIVEDARVLSLKDELFLSRARNLYTAENIGRWRSQLDDYGGENRELQGKISAAENAMMRNTARIESIERTLACIRKMCADADYREVATEKLLRESDRERNELELEGLRLRNEKLRTENENLKKSTSDNDNELPQPVAININVVDAKVRNDDSADT
ncbi:hypothetical protein ACONXG_004211 [Yersinia enterocolitica]